MTKSVLAFLFLILSILCSAQSNSIDVSRYELKGDVTKVRTTLFYSDTKIIHRITDMEFKEGYIQSLIENYPETQIKNSFLYQYRNDKKTYSLTFQQYNNQEKIVDSTSQFQRVMFQNLKFYYPKYELSLQQRKYPESLNISYTLFGEKYNISLMLQKDGSVTETHNFEDFRIQSFNKEGQIISQKFSNRYLNKYFYNENEQIISDLLYQNLKKQSQDRPMKTVYFYENDSKGNWVKKVMITLDNMGKVDQSSFITYETRELIYADGFTSGSSDYDASFIQKITSKFKS